MQMTGKDQKRYSKPALLSNAYAPTAFTLHTLAHTYTLSLLYLDTNAFFRLRGRKEERMTTIMSSRRPYPNYYKGSSSLACTEYVKRTHTSTPTRTHPHPHAHPHTHAHTDTHKHETLYEPVTDANDCTTRTRALMSCTLYSQCFIFVVVAVVFFFCASFVSVWCVRTRLWVVCVCNFTHNS